VSTNVEILKQLLESFNRDGAAAALQYFDDDVEVYDPDLPEGTYRGHAGLLWVVEQVLSGTAQAEVREYELIPAGDRVVALTHTHYSPTDGGDFEVGVRGAHTMTFRDGKIVYWRLYLDRAEALADAGLDPELARPPQDG
jgi:ketosteroid isomerase-like protein